MQYIAKSVQSFKSCKLKHFCNTGQEQIYKTKYKLLEYYAILVISSSKSKSTQIFCNKKPKNYGKKKVKLLNFSNIKFLSFQQSLKHQEQHFSKL